MSAQQTSTSYFDKRQRCNYSLLEQNVMNLKRQNILNELEILRLTGTSVIFENQDIIGSNVVTLFKNRKIINVMVISKTQSGKTGSMCATIKKYLEDTSNLIPIDNIYIITGLSSCEWKEQTRVRMPDSIKNKVYHSGDLGNFVEDIQYKSNVLVIMDEIQIAAKKDQGLYNAFQNARLLDKQHLYERDIKILEYTATPDGTIYDLMKWNDASEKILAEVGDGYVSCYDLYLQGRVKQYKDLCGYNKSTQTVDKCVYAHIKELKKDILRFPTPRYHIIRTKTGEEQNITIKNFKEIFDDHCYDFFKYDKDSDVSNINTKLQVAPKKHTTIFIKEMLRCAKTLHKQFLGVLYDRYTNLPDDTVIIQGLIGRDTGYDNNGESICYTNIDSIIRYEQLWNSKFSDKTVRWNSKTTYFQNGMLQGKNTFNDPKLYRNFELLNSDSRQEIEPVIKKYTTQEDARSYLKNLKGSRGPNIIKPNTNGYYEATIRSLKGIYSCDQIYAERRQGLSKTNFRLLPCYENVNDATTLQWWVIHY